MALVSSHWGRILCHLQAGAEKNFDVHQKNTAGTTVSGSEGISSCSGAALFAATEERGRLGGCGRAWFQRREQCPGIQYQRRVQTRARSVVVRSTALDGKDVECVGNEGLFDKFLEHSVQAVSQSVDVSPLPCQSVQEIHSYLGLQGHGM